MKKSRLVRLVEQAIGIKLYPWQIDFIFHDKPFPDICPCLVFGGNFVRMAAQRQSNTNYYCYLQNRRVGKTLAYCIKIALSKGEPLNIRRPEEFSDYHGNGALAYARGYFRDMFFDVWKKLKAAGLPVRELIGIESR